MYNGSWHPLSPDNIFTVPSTMQSTAGRARAVVDPDANTFSLISSDIRVIDRYLEWEPNIVDSLYSMLVFDYTTVQPEAGGTFSPARLSVDTQSIGGTDDELYSYTDFRSHYLSNKWGAGKLYTLREDTGFDTTYSLPAQSFYICPHLRLNDLAFFGDEPNYLGWNQEEYFRVVLGHYFFNDLSGSSMEGKTFKRFWLDARTYYLNTKLALFPGDDDALEMHFGKFFRIGSPLNTPVFEYDLPVHYLDTVAAESYPVPKEGDGSVGPIINLVPDRLTGRGLSLMFLAPRLGYGASFRGFGGVYIEGPASRYGRPVLAE